MFLCRRESNIFCVKSKRNGVAIEYFNCYEALNKRFDCEDEKKHNQRFWEGRITFRYSVNVNIFWKHFINLQVKSV